MKRILLVLAVNFFANFAFAASDAELKAAQAQAQAIIQSVNAANSNANQGESLFQGKQGRDSTIQDWTKSSVRIDPVQKGTSSYDNANFQNYSQVAQNAGELDENQLALLKSAMRNKNLRAIQQKFLRKTYKGTENTKTLVFEENKTQKITTRFAMATTLIFDKPIDSFIVGDSTGFQVEELPNMKNALAIKPLLIGIDTSLTVFTKDKKLHTFFIFSIDYKSQMNPDFIVYVKNAPENVIIYDDDKKAPNSKDYFIIKEGIAEMKVKKADIYDEYIQKATQNNQWLMAEEIFNDKQFTYFKYDKDKLPQIPTVFVVVDSQDSPQESRVIGNYLIVETTAKKFTLRIGESYVCVEKLTPENADKYLTKKVISKGEKKKIEKSYPKVTPKTKVEITDTKSEECENLQFMSASEWVESSCVSKGKNLIDYFKSNSKVTKKTKSTKAKQ